MERQYDSSLDSLVLVAQYQDDFDYNGSDYRSSFAHLNGSKYQHELFQVHVLF